MNKQYMEGVQKWKIVDLLSVEKNGYAALPFPSRIKNNVSTDQIPEAKKMGFWDCHVTHY